MKSSHGLLLIFACFVAQPAVAQPAVVQTGSPPAPAPRAERMKPEQRAGVLRLAGSNSIGMQLAPELLLAYGADGRLQAPREEQGLTVEERTIVMQAAESSRILRGEIKAHGSAAAFADLLGGKTDIALASRPATAAEAKAFAAARMGNIVRPGNENVVSLDGITFIVHHANPVRTLSASQLRDLMSGAVTRWSDVGGPDLPVSVYAHDDKSGTYEMIQQRLFGRAGAVAKTARLLESSEDLADAVASDPAAIGFVGIASVRNAKPVAIASDCGLPAAEPSAFQVKTEEYPLSRRMYFYLTDKHTPLVNDFVKFALSPAAQPAIERAGFVNLDPILAPSPPTPAVPVAAMPTAGVPAAVARGQALADAISGAQRLSVTIRFEVAKAAVDSRGVDDLERLRHWLRQSGNGRAVTLVGYSSGDGEFESNVLLSRRRAQEVEGRLRALGVQPAAVIGVGPIKPVACETSPENSNLNRRVEVWLR